MALYNFLTGKIRVLENNLLNQTDIDRMVDAPDFEAAFKALNDTDYGAHLLNLEPDQFKEALEGDFQSVRDLMMQWIEKDELLEFMFLAFDAHNVKLYLKHKTSESSSDEHINNYSSATALTDPLLVRQRIVDDQIDTVLHPTTERLVQLTLERLSENASGFEIDSVVDLAMFEILDDRTTNVSNTIRDLYTIQKETVWVKTFLRAKRLNKEKAAVKNVLPETYLRHYDLPEDQALNALSLDPRIRKAYQEYLEHKQLWQLEKELEEAELDVIRTAKLKTGSEEPIVGYFYGKKNAVRNVRLILTAKQNGVPAKDIKERVRALY